MRAPFLLSGILLCLTGCQLTLSYYDRQDVLCPVTVDLQLDQNSNSLSVLDFRPENTSSWNHVLSFTLNDIVGIQRLINLYFVAGEAGQPWYVYMTLDGEWLNIANGEIAADGYRAGRLWFDNDRNLSDVDPDRLLTEMLILDDDSYRHRFIISIDPRSQLADTFEAAVSISGCEVD